MAEVTLVRCEVYLWHVVHVLSKSWPGLNGRNAGIVGEDVEYRSTLLLVITPLLKIGVCTLIFVVTSANSLRQVCSVTKPAVILFIG